MAKQMLYIGLVLLSGVINARTVSVEIAQVKSQDIVEQIQLQGTIQALEAVESLADERN